MAWLFLCILSTAPASFGANRQTYLRDQGPALLSYQELLALGEHDTLDERLALKLQTLTTTPFINNEAYFRGAIPHRPPIKPLGHSLRIVQWNIERGLRLDAIKLLLTNRKQFLAEGRRAGVQVDASRVLDEIEVLQTADVLVLNEVDWGLRRTGYRNVVVELASALNMNWCFGVEFVEIDPINLGTEDFEGIEQEADRQQLISETRVDPSKLRAFHGTAILSRYPIAEARLVPFQKQGYDWYGDEKERISLLEEGKREVVEDVFREAISREIRRGGRTSLIAILDVPHLPEGRLTVAATHLESRTDPENRRHQMEELLSVVRSVRHPLIIAGDLNTSLSDGQPTSIKREVWRRLGSSQFWAGHAVKYATGVGLLYDVIKGGVNFFKNQQDPTTSDIPLVAPNPELGLFELLEDFRFQDGTVFDFRGDPQRTINGTEGTLANSNQRDDKGFAVTFEVDRTVGPAGKLKLDWIFTKSYLESPRNSKGPYRFAPHFARTMEAVNYSLEPRLSDHNPISIDLPFEEPRPLQTLGSPPPQ